MWFFEYSCCAIPTIFQWNLHVFFFVFFFCRYAAGHSTPTIDSDSQVTSGQVSRQDGILSVSFTLPCRSTDSNDVPLAGSHYFLFATGPLVGDAILHHNARWLTSSPVVISCPGNYGGMKITTCHSVLSQYDSSCCSDPRVRDKMTAGMHVQPIIVRVVPTHVIRTK